MEIKVTIIGKPSRETLEQAIIEFQTKKGATNSTKRK